MKTDCVLGFAFNSMGAITQVALIKKNRPREQKDKFNGIGGKIERTETPIQAVVREFKEEAGIETEFDDWEHYATLYWKKIRIFVFCGRIFGFEDIKTQEDEEIVKFGVANVQYRFDLVGGVSWLIPMAIDKLTRERDDAFIAEIKYER